MTGRMIEAMQATDSSVSGTGRRRWRRVLRSFTPSVALCAVLAAPAAGAGDRAPGPALSERVEVLRRVVRVVIEPLAEGPEAEACSQLVPGDLRVVERGRPGRPVALEFDPPPSAFAFLLDTSASVYRPFLARLAEEIERFAARRPSGTFLSVINASDAVLISVRATTRRAVGPVLPDRLVTDHDTSPRLAPYGTSRIWEQIALATAHLAGIPGSKVLIVATDAGDDGSSFPLEVALERISRIEGLKGAVIETPIPPAQTGIIWYPPDGEALRHIAAELGGRVVARLDPRKALEQSLRAVTLSAELTYAVPREGALPGPSRPRVSVRGRLPCRLRVLPERTPREAPEARLTGSAPWSSATGRAVRQSMRAFGLHPGDATRVSLDVAELGLPASWLTREPSSLQAFAVHSPGWILARGPAITVDDGIIASTNAYLRYGRTEETRQRVRRTRQVPVIARVPPAAVARRELRSPEDVLWYLAQQSTWNGRSHRDWPVVTAPFVLEWKSALEWLDPLVETICQAYPEWDRAAGQLRERRIQNETERILEVPLTVADPRRVLVVDEAIRTRVRRERRWSCPSLLNGILGDVPAHALFARVDRRLARELLRAPKDGIRPTVEPRALWARLTSWLPPIATVRAVVPLVPAWSDEQQRFGFWRVVLPLRDRGAGKDLGRDFVPEAPLGALLAEALLRLPGQAPRLLAGQATLADVDYVPVDASEIIGRLEFSLPGGERIRLRGFFARRSPRNAGFRITLRCLAVEGPNEGVPAVRGLMAAVRDAGLLCRPEREERDR